MIEMDTCFKILYSESEDEVSAIIDSNPALSDFSNWRYLDDRPTNFNVVTNQASNGSKALAELCTNMVDAVLMRYAYEAGVDPKSTDAPATVYEGVKELVKGLKGVRNGRLAEADCEKELRLFANEHLQIGITGGRGSNDPLCFTFIDAGEGQAPDDFSKTFLSLQSLNKAEIPFVQGKFNMGSSGVLTYCGEQGYKLIVSRRYDAESSDDWGWTLLRRDPRNDQFVVHYFAPGGEISRFPADCICACCCRSLDGKTWEPDHAVSRAFGTIVKLYNYNLGRGHSANFKKLRAEMNQHLISTILPFRILDYRQTPDPKKGARRMRGIDERQFCGLETSLKKHETDDMPEDSSSERYFANIDECQGLPAKFRQRFDVGGGGSVKLGYFHIYAFPLQQDLPSWLRPNTNNQRVYHAVNGQVHLTLGRGFLSQCGYTVIKDRVLVIVDSTDLKPRAHNDIWKGDREDVRQTSVGQEYLDMVRREIESSQSLREYNSHIRRQERENAVNKGRADALEKLVKKDSSIAQLLIDGITLQMPRIHQPAPKQDGGDFQGLYSPTFLNHAKSNLLTGYLELPVGSQRSVVFSTDARNGYLDRAENTGTLHYVNLPSDMDLPGRDLIDGKLTTKWRCPDKSYLIGRKFTVNLLFGDDCMPEPLSQTVNVNIVSSVNPTPKPPLPPSPRPTPPKPSADDLPTKKQPDVCWLVDPKERRPSELDSENFTVKLWSDPPTSILYGDFDEFDGGFAHDRGEGEFVLYINFHNVHFQNVLQSIKAEEERKLVIGQYEIAMLLQMLGLESAFRRRISESGEINEEMERSRELARRLIAASSANVVLAIIRELPKLFSDNRSADDG